MLEVHSLILINKSKSVFHALDIDEEILTAEGVKLHFVNSFNLDFIKIYFSVFDKFFKIVIVALRLFLLSINLIIIFSAIFFYGKRPPKVMIIQVKELGFNFRH